MDDKIYAEDDPVCRVRKDSNNVCGRDGNETEYVTFKCI